MAYVWVKNKKAYLLLVVWISKLLWHQMSWWICWMLFCARHFFDNICHVSLIFFFFFTLNDCGCYGGSLWVHACLTRCWFYWHKQGNMREKLGMERKRQKSAKSPLPWTNCLHGLWQERECGGKRNEILEGEVLGGNKKKISKETSGFDYENQRRQASLCCLFWLGFSGEVDVVCFWIASGLLIDE